MDNTSQNLALDISIVTLATRDPALIEACLASVEAFVPPHIRYEIIVVLGKATPEVKEVVARTKGVRTIIADVNTGTPAALNLAFGAAQAPYVFALHEDTELHAGCVPRLLRSARRNPQAGAIGTRVLNPDGSLQHLGAVLWSSVELTALHETTAPDIAAATTPFPVGVAAASALFVRREAWEAVGGYDENYFPFSYVDVDFAVAMRAHGYDVLVDPVATTTHRRGASQAAGGGALSSVRFRHWIYERHRERLREKWPDVVGALQPLPDGVDPSAAPPASVALALPAATPVPLADARPAERIITRGAVTVEGPIPEVVRCRLLNAEHAVLDAFARDLTVENAARADEVQGLWTTLQTTRSDASHLREAADRLRDEIVTLNARIRAYEAILDGRWWRLRNATLRAGRQYLRVIFGPADGSGDRR